MTPEAKKALSSTIRGQQSSSTNGGLRQRLLDDLRIATESAYRLSVRAQDAGLDEAARTKRKRLDSWLDEQVRAQPAGGRHRERVEFLREAEQQAAYTLLNRLVILRLMEEPGPSDQPLRKPALIKGGWNSRAYQDFRDLARGVVRDDPTEGFGFLLQLVYEELAEDLPGLFGSAGIADLIPIPAATLRHAVEELNKEELETCWSDDMTLGWVYQYWNDLERERLDAKINDGGKIEPHEIASKTQMFTERYMVDWMLQNSLGLMWSTLCKKNGWIPEVQANGTLQHLEERRIEWRAKRAADEVSLTALMPLENEEERRWAYFLPDQEIPDEAVELAPSSVREWKILDPAVGSGHFLVVALGLLLALFQEEARHRGLQDSPEWSDRAIVEHLLAHTLHGIDIDPRAVQIAAASLWLKGKALCPEIEPEQLNLVAPNLRLADLPDDDPALVELRSDIEVETGIAGEFTSQILRALQGADHLGSLLKIDQAVDTAIEQQERRLKALSAKAQQLQPDLFGGAPLVQAEMDFSSAEARTDLQALLEEFLTRHSSANDLGLRLYGEQFSAGVRLVRMLKEASYHLLIANPPYLTAKHLELQDEFQDLYPEGKGNLYSGFLLRSLQLVKKAGLVSLLTMRGWMFLPTFAEVRSRLSQHNTLVSLMDLGWGAFSEVKDVKVSGLIAMSFEGHKNAQGHLSLAVKPAGDTHSGRTIQDLLAKQAGLLAAECVYTFNANDYNCINGSPLVYWWSNEFLNLYSSTPKISDETDVKQGMATADNRRFLRLPWEVQQGSYSFVRPPKEEARDPSKAWAPYIKGASGKCWIEPLSDLVKWSRNGLEIKLFSRSFVKNEAYFFRQGVSYSTIGNSFSSRVWRYRSIFDVSGSSIFPRDPYSACILMNSSICRDIAGDLNPTENFQVGDVLRVPLFSVEGQDEIFRQLESVFDAHEAARETSIEFRAPGPSRWRDTQDWAQRAVDRFKGDPLSALEASADPVSPSNYLSFALGICLGRFAHVDDDARPLTSNEAGILDPIRADLSHAIPNGILFLDGTLEDNDLRDGLGHTAAASLRDAWTRHGAQIASFESLREWLRCNFFRDVHKDMYDSRPIHWPLRETLIKQLMPEAASLILIIETTLR